jgi:hypothetical protein
LPNAKLKTFGLYGFAGSGKTTILVQTLTFLLKNKLIKSIVFTAPTNKALNVMKSLFKNYVAEIYYIYFSRELPKAFSIDDILDKLYDVGIKIDFITIHKLLKFGVDFSSNGEIIFVRGNGDSLINQYELIIIDECSMIPINIICNIFTEIRLSLQKSSDNYKKTPKIIFSGDPAQLPPVGEDESLIFMNKNKKDRFNDYVKNITNDDNNKNVFNICNNDGNRKKYDILINDIINMSTVTLTKVVRSKSDAVKNVCYQIRLWAMNEIKEPNLLPYIDNKFVKAYKLKLNKAKIKTKWFKKCLKYFRTGQNCNIILTWTNSQAEEYNKTIRSIIFKQNNSILNRFEINDILMLTDFHNLDTDDNFSYINPNNSKFYTSEQIKIIEIQKINKKSKQFTYDLSKQAMKLQNIKYYEMKYKSTLSRINNNISESYLCWKLTVVRISDTNTNIEEDISMDPPKYTIYVIHEIESKKYSDDKLFVTNEIKLLHKELSIKFRDKIKQIETHIIKPLWKNSHKIMMEPFANVNYGYAITCHKSQGSNFYNVFVDIDDIIKNDKCQETKKCLYTALTRTSNELHLLLKP